ncbi:MAG: tetratricopeptide repeat protein [Turneriella sp.]|nr:tetratricopeptide repeat protein [Leptospiraceae bacterium]MCX7633112.1 tetratricopeptide repeat protein [Turneriella sp.]
MKNSDATYRDSDKVKLARDLVFSRGHTNPLLKKSRPVEPAELSLQQVEELTRIKQEARRAYRRKDFVQALARFSDALAIVPGDLEFSYYQALCLFQLHQWERAEELLRQVVEQDELRLLPDVRKLLALTLLKRKKFAEAEKLLSEAVRDYKDDTQLMNMLGYCLERQDKLAEAEKVLLRLLDCDPENPNGLNSLAYIYCRLQKNYTEAIAMVKKALAKEPRNPAYLDTLGMLYARRGNHAAARKMLKQALEYAPGNPEIMAHLTQLH